MISTELSNYLFDVLEDLQSNFQENENIPIKPFIYFEVTVNDTKPYIYTTTNTTDDSHYEINLHINFEDEYITTDRILSSTVELPKFKKIKEDDMLIIENCDCSICLDKFTIGTYKRTLECNHYFHKKCIDKWFKNSNFCPLCKKEY